MVGKLVLEGGEPCVPEGLRKPWPIITQEDIDAVVSVLKGGHLGIAQGRGMPQAEALEREFAEWVGANYCLVLNSGTAALHCAVGGLGLGPGDEVLVPAFTFVATAMAVLHQNVTPIFVDINPDTFLIDPSKMEEKITKNTKAIFPVHIHGLPADMDEIREIAEKYDLRIIEDAAQAFGALYKGEKTGTLGDAAGFSTQTTKHLGIGEGGLMTTNDKEVYKKASMMRITGELWNLYAESPYLFLRPYMSRMIGWNYKANEACSALARSQLRRLDEHIETSQSNAEHLTQRLEKIEGLITPKVPPDRTHSFYIYALRVDPAGLDMDMEPGRLRMAVQKALNAEGVRAMEWQHAPLPGMPLFQAREGYGRGCPWSCRYGREVTYNMHDYPNTIRVVEDTFVVGGLTAPNGFELMDRYAEAFQKVFDNIDRVVEIYNRTEKYLPFEERVAILGNVSTAEEGWEAYISEAHRRRE